MDQRYPQLPSWVELIPPTDRVNELYQKADLMISASRTEGFSFSLAEAIYSGLPVIYSDIPGTSWAGQFKATHVFSSGNADELKQAVRSCIAQEITEEEIGFNQSLMLDKYSISSWVNQIVSNLEKIYYACK